MDCRELMREERRAIRDLVATLAPAQWATPSLCDGWTVRDVVAHLLAWDDLLIYRTRREHVSAFVRFCALYGSSLASMRLLNRRLDARVRTLSINELRRQFGADDDDGLKWLFDRTNPGAHYAEYVLHNEDIRRPLRLTRSLPADRLAAAIDGMRRLPGVRVGARRRHRDVRRAPTLDILLFLAGRDTF